MATGSSRTPFRILLVEDDTVDVRRIQRMLAGEPAFVVTHTESLTTAVQLLASATFDLMLLDLSLPDAVGLEGPTVVRRAAPHLPVVVLTGASDDLQWSVEVLHQGVQDFLGKDTITAAQLIKSIRFAIERQHVAEETLHQDKPLDPVTRHKEPERPATPPDVSVCPTCGLCFLVAPSHCPFDNATLAMLQHVPYRIAERYRLVRKVASGGMGTVFCGYDENLERDVAVKILNQEHFGSAEAHSRFHTEARALARIQHSNVITVFDSGRLTEHVAFIVMELLHGYPLDHVIRQWGRGTPQQVASMLRQGEDALTAAHQASVLHRDIKAENFYLASMPNGYRVKLLDFGIAKNLKVDSSVTQAGMVIGSPAYMAPELLNGQTADVRSDLYSFAAVAYEALLGRRITLATELLPALLDIVEHDPPPPTAVVPSLTPAIDAAFQHALHKDPTRRPASVQEWVSSFVDDLETCPATTEGWHIQLPR